MIACTSPAPFVEGRVLCKSEESNDLTFFVCSKVALCPCVHRANQAARTLPHFRVTRSSHCHILSMLCTSRFLCPNWVKACVFLYISVATGVMLDRHCLTGCREAIFRENELCWFWLQFLAGVTRECWILSLSSCDRQGKKTLQSSGYFRLSCGC